MKSSWMTVLGLAIAAPAAAQVNDANMIFGDAAACGPEAHGPAVLVRVNGFRDRTGNLRIAIYRAREEEFLASGKFVTRIDTPVTSAGPMTVCAPVPQSGPHIIVALHDRNADGRLNVWSDGFGFSNNPRLGASKPDVALVGVNLVGIVPMGIILNYAQGLSARPWPVK
jgi:uncharacterized protein (DUF2141 family)